MTARQTVKNSENKNPKFDVDYRVSIGLEVHVQLKTQSKMFCSCSTRFGAAPNTNVCPVCLGYPGAMPVMNADAIRLTALSGLIIGASISGYSKFDRKSYFYPDMPKNYQITQYDMPLCLGGGVNVDMQEGSKFVRVRRIHLEEDVAKNMHFSSSSGVDFNRAGVPLMEIVTEPDMDSPEEAYEFLRALKQMLLYGGVSEGNLEEGNVRCDVNCSVRPESSEVLGTKTELKNLNTFKGVLNALKYEVQRQLDVVVSGGTVGQETRRWDMDKGITYAMRSKEDVHDYRYFPEPDLMPVALSAEEVDIWKNTLPEMPRERHRRLVEQYSIPDYDAGVLVADKDVADYFETAAKLSSNPKAVSNWIMTEMLRLLDEAHREIKGTLVTPRSLAKLIDLVDAKTIHSTAAKEVFAILFNGGGDPETIVKERGLAQVSDTTELKKYITQVISENAKSVEDYRRGKKAALQFLVGQVMRLSRGKANPSMVGEMLTSKLTDS